METKVIHAVVSGHLVIRKQDISEKMRNILYSQLQWENPEYADAAIRGMSTRGMPKFLYAIHLDEKKDLYYIAREYWPQFDALAEQLGYIVKYTDNRISKVPMKLPHSIKLWKPQRLAAYKLMEEHQGVMKSPCGSGKTIISLFVAAEMGQNTLILVHTNALIQQWRDYCKKMMNGYEPGIIQGDKFEIKQITIASVMTISKRVLDKEFLEHWGMIILDEAHHCPAASFNSVMTQFPAYYRFGVTATPSRSDSLEGMLFAVCGPIIAEITYDQLKRAGKIIPPIVSRIETGFTYPYTGIRSYQPMLKALGDDPRRNAIICSNVVAQARTGAKCQIVLSQRIDHIVNLKAMLQRIAPRLKVEFLLAGGIKKDKSGRVVRDLKMSKAEIQDVIDRARNGDVDVLLGTSIADEGLDIPNLDRLHLVFPSRADAKVEQQVGRIQRTSPGKTNAIVFDYVDNISLLRDQAADRRAVYTKSMGLEVSIGGYGSKI